jgi:hypothetical protein
MRKLPLLLLAVCMSAAGFSQSTTTTPTPKLKKIINRPGDHLMLQLADNSLQGVADSVKSHEKGLNRSFNAAIMFDKPFKSNPQLSFAIGLGVTTSDIYFSKMTVNIISTRSTLPFVAADTGNKFKKYKLNETFLEVPAELRFMVHPETPNKSIKAAVGIKIGTLLNAHTKGKILENSAGTKISDYTVKESGKDYFNTTRLAATARVGYGVFSIFAAYNITNVFKDGVAPDTKLFQFGLTISGL